MPIGYLVEQKSKIQEVAVEKLTKINRVFLKPSNCKVAPGVVEAIQKADCIVIGPGSLYTNVIPNLLVNGVVKAIKESTAIKVYVSNIMTELGQTDDYSVSDHLNAIIDHCGNDIIDYCIYDTGEVIPEFVKRYNKEGQDLVEQDIEKIKGIKFLQRDLSMVANTHVRHDPKSVAASIIELICDDLKYQDKQNDPQYLMLNTKLREEKRINKIKKSMKKKEKKKKEKPEPNPESELASETKKGKRVSVKSMIVIAGLCLTMTAMIIVMCSIIPAFFDKRAARDAFYESNYTKSYELLYGKERDENDDMIYHKSKTILEMRRKLDSYHNYMAIGKEVQALDALMSAVQSYPEILRQAEEFRVVQEVNAIYETILTILNDKYSLTEALAQTIIEYDDVTYTRRLESLVYNTPFVLPETQQESPAEDILPEERALMEEEEAAEAETGTAGEEAGMAEQGSEQDEFPMETEENDESGENPQEQDIEEQQPVEEQQPAEQGAVPEETAGQTQSSSLGEDVSTWTEDGGFGSQGEQIQGIRQPIGIEIHGN